MDGQISQIIIESGDKIALVNSIRITKPINLLSFCTVLGSVVTEGDFHCTVYL